MRAGCILGGLHSTPSILGPASKVLRSGFPVHPVLQSPLLLLCCCRYEDADIHWKQLEDK